MPQRRYPVPASTTADAAAPGRRRTRSKDLEDKLAGEQRRAARHTRRLEALWKLASTQALDDDSFLRAVLVEASGVLRPGTDFHGAISHLDGSDIVVDVIFESELSAAPLVRGSRLPVNDSVLGQLLRTGGTTSFGDLHAAPALAAITRVRASSWRAFVGTPFRVGPLVYFLDFVSRSPLAEPFTAEDHAYVEIVASFCSSRLQQRVQYDRLRHQSTHDALTGLPNRAAFRGAVAKALMQGGPVAVAVIDVDSFRAVNELLGHQTADAVLVEIAAALSTRVGESDAVARLGGDTFGVLLRHAGARGALEARVERLHAAFAERFGTGDREGSVRVAVTASIGVAVSPGDGATFEQLLAHADAAVRTAKENGRARWSFFDRKVEDAFAAARTLQNDLAQALVRGEFVLHFQPHVEIATGRIVGAEALIRWQHPERGLLSPAEFVPFAEDHAMLGAIGAWVMQDTARAARPWRRADPAFRTWFNLSAFELNDPQLLSRLSELGDDVSGLGVEITESDAMRDVYATTRTIAALREAGLAIALDDFGTGFSSLAHLKRLPIDMLKIDGTFTAGVPDDPHDVAIVEAVVGIAKRFGFATIAEGVETLRQAEFLSAAGCPHAQGYAYAPALTEDAFAAYLRARETPQAARRR